MGDKKRNKGEKVLLIMTDVAKERLANRIRDMQKGERIARWTKDMLSGRQVKLRVDGEEGERHEVETEIQQGSLASPILSNLYISPLLRTIEEKAWEWAINIITPTFVDDVTFAIAGDTWEEAMEGGEKVLKWEEEWGEERDVKFEREKMQWIRQGKQEAGEEKENLEMKGGERK